MCPPPRPREQTVRRGCKRSSSNRAKSQSRDYSTEASGKRASLEDWMEPAGGLVKQTGYVGRQAGMGLETEGAQVRNGGGGPAAAAANMEQEPPAHATEK